MNRNVPNHAFWLGTNSGRIIDLLDPKPEQITIEDIACGLSKVCRFNGQIKRWYSVAEHSIHVAELVPTKYKRCALLHDASEAYLCDIPTPLKRLLGVAYTQIEDRVTYAISIALKQDDLMDLPECVKKADTSLCVTERDLLTEKPLEWGEKYEEALRYPNLQRIHHDPHTAYVGFLEKYGQYTKN